ncbi:hypothetical protein PR202_gb06141 [Eleusine coracana subsp. coracana]|uniref:Uncharacterized protein n=1 Tax=Eleusine coracana subsp. coracana TaxID=191504 RepID=A0AAV5E6C3_ELECO|nr:hypothetical protein QOZ80_2BG0154150 [Eleusine coracana subsp. coracana]GJN18929.1 hypothetical protein PR202_gb06141 [Eleusine coracana subsp. coracana]
MARFDSVLSFTRDDQPTNDKEEEAAAYDNNSDDDAGFEFAFAPPLTTTEDAQLAPADDLFAHGRILPAYPVFDRHHLTSNNGADELARPHQESSSTAPPSPDSFCAWAPRSAPGSPAREFPKSASTGEARRFWRLRDLVGGRSHSDGKEKFLFLHPSSSSTSSKMPANNNKQANKPSSPAAAPLQHHQHQQKQGRKKGGVAAEMDMATAHKLFYGGKHQQGGAAGETRHYSFLPYRGFFATAQALGRSHHPY